MAKRKCTFNDDWLRIKEFESWPDKVPNRSVAYCKLCQQSFDVSNMGRSASNSHAKVKKHKEKEDSRKSLPITFFRQETVDKPSTSKQSADTSKEQSNEAQVISPQQKSSQCTLPFMMSTSNVTGAEILWAIRTCQHTAHYVHVMEYQSFFPECSVTAILQSPLVLLERNVAIS